MSRGTPWHMVDATDWAPEHDRQWLMIRELRVVSVTEAVSYLALLIATIIKWTGGSELGVTILGPIHGALYLVFVGFIVWRRNELGWSWVKAITAMIAGSLPFGGFWIDQKWLAPLEPNEQ